MTASHRVRFAVSAALCLLVAGCATAPADAERMLGIRADIVLSDEGRLEVCEDITVQSAGARMKHGISRSFPTEYTDREGRRHALRVDVTEVLRDGRPAEHFLRDVPGARQLCIGSESVPLPPGRHTYTIVFRADPVIERRDGRAILHWDVTGAGSVFPLDEARVTVDLPDTIPADELATAGYTGAPGSMRGNVSVGADDAGRVVFRSTRPLGVGEGMHVLVSWPEGGQQGEGG